MNVYRRYIPPPKAKAQPPPQPHFQQEQRSSTPAQARPPSPSPAPSNSATPYARYIPPPKTRTTQLPSKTHIYAAAIPPPEAVPAKIVFNYDDDQEHVSSPNKRKRDSAHHDDDDGAVAGPPGKRPKESTHGIDGKEKKHRSKKHKSRENEENEEKRPAEDDGTSQRKKDESKKKRTAEEESFAFGFSQDAQESAPNEAEKARNKHDTKKRRQKKPQNAEPTFDETQLDTVSGEISQAAAANDAERTQDADQSQQLHRKKDKGQRKGKQAIEGADEVTAREKAVLEKAAKSLRRAQKETNEGSSASESAHLLSTAPEVEEPFKVHGLEPLPQPAPVIPDSSKPTYETLPSWIASPIRVASGATASFTDLGLDSKIASSLESKGYKDAFAVQTAVIPLLLPSADRQGDVVVSAATGSGKTLAYVLPMIRDISQGVVARLRGVIVVPTRELVSQAARVCETCASVFSRKDKKTVKIGISMGNKPFKEEQRDLVREGQRYDPSGYQAYLKRRTRFGLDALLAGEGPETEQDTGLLENAPKPLPDHVVGYVSRVDVLICTPGRLVEHINLTPGFSLDHVRWLVVDEADKLLAQSFQQWVDVVMAKLGIDAKPGARDFPDSNKSGVRKVVLSATMTRDLSLLNGLKLSRPKLVTLEGTREVVDDEDNTQEQTTEHVLPDTLQEAAIKIRDPDLKPLYLLDLLDSKRMTAMNAPDESVAVADTPTIDDNDDTSSSDSDSDPDSSSESSSDDSDDEATPNGQPSRAKPFHSTVLIFTKSNETAVRLSRLISLLSPHLAPMIGTLTSTTRTSERRKTLRDFAAYRLRILVASDLVARGIDLANLDHVVNYDMPTSVASYVHRVGRTARAGRKGHAWTLFTWSEARWFWTAIGGHGAGKSGESGQIQRKDKVEEVRVGGDEHGNYADERVAEYEGALERLGQEASGMKEAKKAR